MKASSRYIKSLIGQYGLYADGEFECVREYERLRSERSGIVHTHVVIDVNLEIVRPRKLKTMLAEIVGKMRTIDHIGWISSGQIGILLPGTDETGARGFLNNIDASVNGIVGINVEEVSTYFGDKKVFEAVSSSIPEADVNEAMEAEEVTVIPFNIAE